MSFSNFGGGLVNTIVAGAGNNISSGLANQLTSNIQFSVSRVLANSVQDSSGYVLDQGQNYLLSQIGSALPSGTNNQLANAVVTQVASVGLNAAKSFASKTISNVLSGKSPFSGLGSAAGAALGLGAGGGSAAGGGFIGLNAQGLPDADYGENRFTTQDIVFSIVPANAGPQTQSQPQSSPTIDWTQGFSADFNNKLPGLGDLKGQAALAGPASGLNIGGKNFGSTYKAGKIVSSGSSGLQPIPSSW
jgi:hypothetical protein